MSKRRNLIEELNASPGLTKKKLPGTRKVEEVVKKEHKADKKETGRKYVRTTFDIPMDMHQALKTASKKEYISIRQYAIRAIAKSLKADDYMEE